LPFSGEKRPILKEVVFGVVGPAELFPVAMLDSSCFWRSFIPDATRGEVERAVGTGKLGPRGGQGGLSARTPVKSGRNERRV